MQLHILRGQRFRLAFPIAGLGLLLACQADVTNSNAGLEAVDPVGQVAVTADSMRRFMVAGGCMPIEARTPGLVVALGDRSGVTTRYRCDDIGQDSMLALASQYARMVRDTRVGWATMMATGYWDYETHYREYCRIDLGTREVLYCGIFLPYQVAVWVPGGDGAGPTDGGGGGGGSGAGSGSGSAPSPAPDELPLCDQTVNPNCHQPLTVDDIARLNQSYQYLRDTTGVWADTVAQRECKQLFAGLEFLRAQSAPRGVFRGIDTVASPLHDAEGYQGSWRFHFDPPILDSATTPGAQKFLLSTALHEVAHAMNYADHGHSTNYSLFDYFKYTNATGPNSCVVP